jgi:hypothetical protein
MVERYFELLPYVNVGLHNNVFTESVVLPSAAVRVQLEDLKVVAANLQFAMKQMQEKQLSALLARNLFDHTLEHHQDRFPVLKEYLKADAIIVHSPHFESGVYKLQCSRSDLTPQEKNAVKCFLVGEQPPAEEPPEEEEKNDGDFEQQWFKKVKTVHATEPSINTADYRSTEHVLPTTNDVERLFSQAKLCKGDHRRRMGPGNLEACLFLKQHAQLWRDKNVLQNILDKVGATAEGREMLSKKVDDIPPFEEGEFYPEGDFDIL